MRTVSLELSKLLKENGYPQEENLDGYAWGFDGEWDLMNADFAKDLVLRKTPMRKTWKPDWCYSPTADEILEQIPQMISGIFPKKSNNIFACYFLNITKYEYGNKIPDWTIYYKSPHSDCWQLEFKKGKPFSITEESLANAAAQMWLYLKQNGLLEV